MAAHTHTHTHVIRSKGQPSIYEYMSMAPSLIGKPTTEVDRPTAVSDTQPMGALQ